MAKNYKHRCMGQFFSARQHICCDSIYAVCLSICPSHGWISQRQLKLGSRNLHHRVAPWLFSWCLTSPWNSKGKIGSAGTE